MGPLVCGFRWIRSLWPGGGPAADLDVHEFSFVLVGANRDVSIAAVKSAPAGRPRLSRARTQFALLAA